MRKATTLLAVVVLLTSAAAQAGVVIEENEVINAGGGGQPTPRKHTVMVQDHKQKVDMGRGAMIIDLDKNTTTILNSRDHTYFETAFPPTGPGSEMMKALVAQGANYQKTAGARTVAGYKCQEYSSSAKMKNGEYSSTACYSSDAPGASDYDVFQSAMVQKLVAAGMGAHELPKGVPLAVHTSTKITSFSIPGMAPEQAKMLSQMMANRPPVVTDTTVTKLTIQKLADDAFAIPAGYTKREMPTRMPGAMGAMTGHAPGAGAGGGTMAHPPAGAATP